MKTIVLCGRPGIRAKISPPSCRRPGCSLPPPGPPLAIFSVAGEDSLCFCRCHKTDINDPFLVNQAGPSLVRRHYHHGDPP